MLLTTSRVFDGHQLGGPATLHIEGDLVAALVPGWSAASSAQIVSTSSSTCAHPIQIRIFCWPGVDEDGP